ncbi:MAG: O-antigen ligase family protein [Flavobacteriales bacterium]
MTEAIRNNIAFYMLLIIWFVAGYISNVVPFVVIPVSVLLLRSKRMYGEILMGFLFVLVLSDNLEAATEFAETFKNVYIVMLLGIVAFDKSYFNWQNTIFRLYLPFFIVSAACLMYSPVISTAVQKNISYIILFAVVPVYFRSVFEKEGVSFIRNFILFIVIILMIGVLFGYVNPEVAFSHGSRWRGIFGNPNGLGVFLIVTALLGTICFDLFPETFSRRFKIVFWAIILIVVLKSGSRTALVAIIFFHLFIRINRISVFLSVFLFICLLAGTEFIINYSATVVRFMGLQNVFRVDTLEDGSGRLVAWYFAWKNIEESIFIGRGFAFDEHLMRSNFDYLSRLGHEGGVHNTYLILWLNTGLVGLIFFLRGFFLSFISASKNSPLAIPAMFAIMFSINFEPWLAASLNPYTILFLVVVVLLSESVFRQHEKPVEENEEAV